MCAMICDLWRSKNIENSSQEGKEARTVFHNDRTDSGLEIIDSH